MSKRLRMSIIIAALCLGVMPLQAQSEAALTSNVENVKEGSTWTDKEEAPGLKITIKDAYKRAGKTEKIILKLDNAVWADRNGTSVQIYDAKNIDAYKVALMSRGEDCLQLNVDIPSDIEEGDEVSFVVALMIEARDKEVSVVVEPGDESELISTQKVLVGAQRERKVTWEVEDIPSMKKEGTIAPITFTELRPYIIEDEIEITLKLQNTNLAFGDFDYISEKVHSDDTDYELNSDDYITYGGGFAGMNTTVMLKKINNDDKTIIFKVKGGNTSEVGSITLKNIPIINKSSNVQEESVLLTLEGDAIVDTKKDIVVGYIKTKTSEEEQAEQDAIIAEEEKQQTEKEKKKGIQFTVGKNYYSVDGEQYEMDAATFVQEPGYIMVPLKYVALALGVYEEDIQYNNGMIYFKYGNKTVELRVNSDVATVNRVNIPMDAPIVVKDGRSYAPIGEVARLLGLSKAWNNAEKTATFGGDY